MGTLDKDFNVTVSVGANKKQVDVRELLDIDVADLSTEFARQSSLFAYFAVLTAKAERIWLDAKDATKRSEAEAFAYYKEDKEIIISTGKPCTDGFASQLVIVDDACVEAHSIENAAKEQHMIMKALSEAFEQRSRMLQSMGADARAEMGMTGMSVKVDSNVEAVRKLAEGVKNKR